MQRIVILGLGKSGVASARHALDTGADLTIYAGASSEANRHAAAEFERAGVPVIFDSETVEGTYDICVVSPGISQIGAFYRSGASASSEIMTEPEYAWRLSPHDWIAVTGTNGKTTTTSLVAHLLNACGHEASACGNIGATCMHAVLERKQHETLVAEMSSYQLASTDEFAPEISILLNITPDHIAWHGSYEAYAQAKFKVFANMRPGSTAVISSSVIEDYPLLVERLANRGIRVVRVGKQEASNCAFRDANGTLCYVDGHGNRCALLNESELPIKGEHNVQNALCAACAALAHGCALDCVREGLASFKPLEHRLEPCGSIDSVSFYNDSKATNVDATLKALTAFPEHSVILMLGGRDKGTALDDLVDACAETCEAVIAYGEAGERFYEALAGSPVSCHREGSMQEAFERACTLAKPGHSVVLSPACASFDEFDSFEQRGDVFKGYVKARMES